MVQNAKPEIVLPERPLFDEARLAVAPNGKAGETIKTPVVLRPRTQVGDGALFDFCRDRTAHRTCPTSVDVVDALARTATGKPRKFRASRRLWKAAGAK